MREVLLNEEGDGDLESKVNRYANGKAGNYIFNSIGIEDMKLLKRKYEISEDSSSSSTSRFTPYSVNKIFDFGQMVKFEKADFFVHDIFKADHFLFRNSMARSKILF